MNDWALHYSCDARRLLIFENGLERIYLLVINNIPKLNPISSCEYELIDVSGRMHHYVEITIELLLSHYLSCLDVEDYEFAILGQREYEVR